VAGGRPLPGTPDLLSRVVIADFEDGIGDTYELTEQISWYLGLSGAAQRRRLSGVDAAGSANSPTL